MHFEFNFYSSLLLIFFVHGLVYSLLMLRKGFLNDSTPEKWLAVFLFLCILYIAPWMIGFAGWYDNQPYRDILFYVPFQHLYFLGPVVFFYVQSLLNPAFRFRKKHWLHLLPGGLYLLFSLTMFVVDKIILKRYFFLESQADPDFDDWYQWSGIVSMFFYFVLSFRYYQLYQKMIVQMISYADMVLFSWIKHFLMAFLLMLTLRVAFDIFFLLVPALSNYVGSWWYFLSFAIVFYYIAISGYANNTIAKIAFKVQHLLTYHPTLLLSFKPSLLLENNKMQPDEIDFIEISNEKNVMPLENSFPLNEWKERIEKLFTTAKIYKDAELCLTDLAKQLQTNPSLLSKIINQGFGINFNDYVNQYRVGAIIEKLKLGEQKSQTLMGIAYDCGFNSKATFNRAFKKVTGFSPKAWEAENSGTK